MAEEVKEAKKVICDTCETLEVEPELVKKGGKTCQTCINKGAKKKTPTKQAAPSQPLHTEIKSPVHHTGRRHIDDDE